MNLIRNNCASWHGIIVQIVICASKFFISNESRNFHFRMSAIYIAIEFSIYRNDISTVDYCNGGGGFVEVDVEVPTVVVVFGAIFTPVLVVDVVVPLVVVALGAMFVPVLVAGPEFPTVVVALGAIFTPALVVGVVTFSSGSLTTIFSFFATSV